MDANQRDEAKNEDPPGDGDVQRDLVRHSQSQSILMADADYDARVAQQHFFMMAVEFVRHFVAEVSSIIGALNEIINDGPAMLLPVEQHVEKASVLQQLNERLKDMKTLLAIKKDELKAKGLELDAKGLELDAKVLELDAEVLELDAKDLELDARELKEDAKKLELDARERLLAEQMPNAGANAAPPILHMHESGLIIHIGNGNWAFTDEWEKASDSEKINRMHLANCKEGEELD